MSEEEKRSAYAGLVAFYGWTTDAYKAIVLDARNQWPVLLVDHVLGLEGE